MTRNMFISTHHHWLSKLALLGCLIVLSEISLGAYLQLLPPSDSFKTSLSSIQSYLSYSIFAIILFSTIMTWYLQRKLTFKPFFISLLLLFLIVSQSIIPWWTKFLLLTDHTTLIKTIMHLCILSLFWCMKSMIDPVDHVYISETDKKYRLWAFLGLLLLFLQIIFTAWATLNHADDVCKNLYSCRSQFISVFNFHILQTSPLSQEGLETLYIMANLAMIITTSYLLMLSILVIFSRSLSEKGILLFFLITTEMAISITEFLWHKSFWLTFSRDILFLFIILAMTSLLMDLFRKPAGLYS